MNLAHPKMNTHIRPHAPVASSPAQRGMTLIELMISMLLGLILVFAATTLFEITKRTTRTQEATARLMENGRAATEILNRSVRMARFYGCAGVDSNQVNNHFDTSNAAQTNTNMNGYDQQGIFGIEGASGAPDEIIIFRALSETAKRLAGDLDLGAEPLTLIPAGSLDPNNPAVGDMLSLTDCLKAEVFSTTARSFNAATGREEYLYDNCPTCQQDYLANALVLRVAQEHFYVKTGTSGVNALFVADPNDPGTERELIEGVEDMQISYGIDTDVDGVANQYVPPATIWADCNTNNNATCWRQVASVRIALLLATVDDHVTTKPQTYSFNGVNGITATDYRLRREFLGIIALRNYRP